MVCLESGFTYLNHDGEELCGDKVEIKTDDNYTTVVLADGLGSGVKANILATLTSKILCTMVSNDIAIEDCVETIIESLPVCKVRQVAYSTFSVIHIENVTGKGYLIEFDNPEAILIRGGKCLDLERVKITVKDKVIYKTPLSLKENDFVVLMSDGVVHAGIDKTLNFGWERKDIKEYLEKTVNEKMSARCVACLLAGASNDLYLGRPGDDATALAIKVRKKLSVTVMVGPPVDKEKDAFYISQFLDCEGKKVVCGGTSATIVARHLGKEVTASFDFPDKEIPPIGFIEGIDLVTEGVLTLRRLLDLSEKYLSNTDLTPKHFEKKDGASLLGDILFEQATHIEFFVGQSINKAHQGLPIDTTMKLKLIERLSANLTKMGKTVKVNYD